MNREILFRAKTEGNRKWVKGLLNYCSDNGSITKLETYAPHSSGVYTIDPGTTCQYIGSTDKNDTKIFEGDIVRGKMHCYYGYKMCVGVVVYYDNAFKVNIDPDGFMGDYKNIPPDCEVIGNIFDDNIYQLRECVKRGIQKDD